MLEHSSNKSGKEEGEERESYKWLPDDAEWGSQVPSVWWATEHRVSLSRYHLLFLPLLVVPHGALIAFSTVVDTVYIALNTGRLAYAKIRVIVYFSPRS